MRGLIKSRLRLRKHVNSNRANMSLCTYPYGNFKPGLLKRAGGWLPPSNGFFSGPLKRLLLTPNGCRQLWDHSLRSF